MSDAWKPSVTVAAVIERDGLFLLVEEETKLGLRLNNPAGHLEPGETPAQGCAREVLEDLLSYRGHYSYWQSFIMVAARGKKGRATSDISCAARRGFSTSTAGNGCDTGCDRAVTPQIRGKVLVTGAHGFIGRALCRQLTMIGKAGIGTGSVGAHAARPA